MTEWKVDRIRNLNKEIIHKILNTYERFDGKATSTLELGRCLEDSGLYTKSMNGLSNKDIEKKWGSYIGLFTSNALGYCENVKGQYIFQFTPLARQLISKEITYNEYIIKVLSRTQFPKPGGHSIYTPDSEFDKPFIKILKCLYILYFYSEREAWIDYYDIVTHLESKSYVCNYIKLCNDIITDRKKGKDRTVTHDGRDIFMHKCSETNLILEDNNIFYLCKDKIKDVKKVILENDNEYFNGDKKEWNQYWGGRIE